MKKLMIIAASAALLLGVPAGAQAQEEVDYSAGHNFITVQGGAQATLTHYKFMDLVTPQYALSFGRYFNDKIGARLHVQGYKINSGFKADRYAFLSADRKYGFKDITGDIDLLVNLSNLLNPNRTGRAFNWYGVLGFGVNYTWGTGEFNKIIAMSNAGNYYMGQEQCGNKHSSFNGRLGTGVEVNLSKNFAISLEADANYKNDQFNYKFNDRCDWQVAAFVGLTYKFGVKTVKKEKVVPEEVWETRVDTVWYNDTEYKTAEVAEELHRDIHYQIRKADPVSERIIKEIVDFVKSHKDVKVVVTGYADKGTGNAKLNMKYSEERAVAVADALKDAGVSADMITVEWKGDTVQPFAENDENRVAITVVSGKAEKKEPVTVKKFRTEEKRVRIQ